jgi:hypothetical protein
VTGQSYQCIAQLSEARRLYGDGRFSDCLRIIESIRNCTKRCGEEAVCNMALRLAVPSVEDVVPAG